MCPKLEVKDLRSKKDRGEKKNDQTFQTQQGTALLLTDVCHGNSYKGARHAASCSSKQLGILADH